MTARHSIVGTALLLLIGAAIFKGFKSKDPLFVLLREKLQDEIETGNDNSVHINAVLYQLGLNQCPSDIRALYKAYRKVDAGLNNSEVKHGASNSSKHSGAGGISEFNLS